MAAETRSTHTLMRLQAQQYCSHISDFFFSYRHEKARKHSCQFSNVFFVLIFGIPALRLVFTHYRHFETCYLTTFSVHMGNVQALSLHPLLPVSRPCNTLLCCRGGRHLAHSFYVPHALSDNPSPSLKACAGCLGA